MFDNIGKEIKTLAVVLTVIGIAASIIIGASLFNGSSAGTFLGIAVMLVGTLISWIASFALYGFGELVDKTAETAETNRQLLEIIAHQNGIDLASQADTMRGNVNTAGEQITNMWLLAPAARRGTSK